MMKFCKKMDKHTFILMFTAFLWVMICNLLVQAFLTSEAVEAAIGNIGWTIFLANVLFFIKNNPNTKEALLENALGGIFGLIGGYLFLKFFIWAETWGCPALLAKMIPIAIFLFLTIALHPTLPYVFNNNAICFFLVSLINKDTQVGLLTHPFTHFAGVIVGNLVVNLGIVILVGYVGKKLAKGKE
ncbi:MAG: hypothetical protein IK127_05950 [Clostridia bacterium]|nr:hypothetical protein [Clostridia bacterium]